VLAERGNVLAGKIYKNPTNSPQMESFLDQISEAYKLIKFDEFGISEMVLHTKL